MPSGPCASPSAELQWLDIISPKRIPLPRSKQAPWPLLCWHHQGLCAGICDCLCGDGGCWMWPRPGLWQSLTLRRLLGPGIPASITCPPAIIWIYSGTIWPLLLLKSQNKSTVYISVRLFSIFMLYQLFQSSVGNADDLSPGGLQQGCVNAFLPQPSTQLQRKRETTTKCAEFGVDIL